MKKIFTKKATIFLFTFLLAVSIIMIACQNATEPEVIIKDISFSLSVEDQSGNPISGVQIKYAPQANAGVSELIPFSYGITGNNGTLSERFSVPDNGKFITLLVTPPQNDPQIVDPSPITYNAVKVLCRDTTFKVIIPKQLSTPCDVNIGLTDVKPISICYQDIPSESVFTPYFAPSCTEEMTIEVSSFSNIQQAELIIYNASQPGVNQTSPFTLSPGDKFEIGMKFSPTMELPLRTDNIVVQITPTGGSKYTYTTIMFSAESKCQKCTCPESFNVVYPSETNFAALCVNEAKDFDITLNNIFNSSTECNMVLSLEKNFSNPNIKIVSINNSTSIQDIILTPGSSMQKMRVNALLTTDGNVTDELVFKVTMRYADGNLLECPNSKVRVNVRLNATSPSCSFNMLSPIFAPPYTDTQNTITLKEGIGTNSPSGTTYVEIRNPSTECPLHIEGLVITGDPFYFLNASGNSIGKTIPKFVIDKNSSAIIRIGFRPTETDYDRNNPAGPKTQFTGVLTTIPSTNPNCMLDALPLKGEISFPGQNSLCLEEFGTNDYVVGAFFGYNGEITKLPSSSKDFALYFNQVNLSGTRSAQMQASGPSSEPGKFYVKFSKIATGVDLNVGQSIRDLAFIYSNQIGASTPTEVIGSVNEKDLVHIRYSFTDPIDSKKYEYNALIYIYSIRQSNATNPATPEVCFAFCVGV